jgi:hypothetical protein
MRLLTRKELVASLISDSTDSISLDPLLREDQVGEVSVDLRLGYDFLVSVLTRSPAVELKSSPGAKFRGIQTYFQETRRTLGERFVLYPHQLVLGHDSRVPFPPKQRLHGRICAQQLCAPRDRHQHILAAWLARLYSPGAVQPRQYAG